MDYSNYIGKRHPWSEVQKIFPNKWIAMSDCIFIDNNFANELESGIIRDICTDEERDADQERIQDYTGIYWRRTTDIVGVNFLW